MEKQSMKHGPANERGWCRRNWKSVATVWGVFLVLLFGTGLFVFQQSFRHRPTQASLRFVEPSADYPLAVCVVTGRPLAELRVAVMYDGTEVQLC